MQDADDQFDFNDRYGIRASKSWVSYAIVAAIVGGAWLLWSGLHHANPTVSSTLISFVTQDPRNPEIRYTVDRKNGADEVICTLAARDYEMNVVGQVDDVIPAGERSVQRVITIPTRADAVNAGIESCHIR